MIDRAMAMRLRPSGGFLTMSERGLRAFLTAANEGEAECLAEYP